MTTNLATLWLVPRRDSRYSANKFAHMFPECPAIRRARSRGGYRRIESPSIPDGRTLCGTCARWGQARLAPVFVRPSGFQIEAANDGDGIWLNCPDPLCPWQSFSDGARDLDSLLRDAREHAQQAHRRRTT